MKGSEITKTEPVYPETEYKKAEELIGKDLKIKGYALLTGREGDFAVINAEVENQNISFSCGGKVILEKLKKYLDYFKQELKNNKVEYKDVVEATLTYPKTKDGRYNYYDLE